VFTLSVSGGCTSLTPNQDTPPSQKTTADEVDPANTQEEMIPVEQETTSYFTENETIPAITWEFPISTRNEAS